MDWGVILVVFLIPLAVWIFSTLVRGNEEERAQNGRRRGPRAGGMAPGRPRPATSDIDRFLEEISRRRREGGPRPTPPAPQPAPAPTVQLPPTPRPQRRPGPTPRPKAPAKPTPPRVVQEIPQVVEVVVSEPVPTPPRPASPAPVAPPAGVRRPVNPMAAQLLNLLRSPQGIRTAILLHEIFGPPVCRRARRLSGARGAALPLNGTHS
jgi:hypothetical protein